MIDIDDVATDAPTGRSSRPSPPTAAAAETAPTLAEQVARLRARVVEIEADADLRRDARETRELRLVALVLAEVARAVEGEG